VPTTELKDKYERVARSLRFEFEEE